MTTKKSDTTAPADPVVLARAEVQRLADRELELGKLQQSKAAELAGIRTRRGRQVLDAGDADVVVGEIGRQIRELDEGVESLAEAGGVARQQRLAAIAGVFAAEADDAERRAERLDGEADANETKVREALAAVVRVADWEYVPLRPQAPEGFIGGEVQGGAPHVVDARGPRYERLRREAASLRDQAGQLRYKQPVQAGAVDAAGFEDLIAAVFADPLRLGPTVADIYTWSERASRRPRVPEKERRHQIGADNYVPIDNDRRPEVWHLEWRASKIDAAASMITTLALGSMSDADFEAAVATETSAAAAAAGDA